MLGKYIAMVSLVHKRELGRLISLGASWNPPANKSFATGTLIPLLVGVCEIRQSLRSRGLFLEVHT